MSTAVTIFVELPDEAVRVWRPVLAEHIYGGAYRILEQPYNQSDERWEFVPGEEVICEFVPMEGGTKVFVAKRRA